MSSADKTHVHRHVTCDVTWKSYQSSHCTLHWNSSRTRIWRQRTRAWLSRIIAVPCWLWSPDCVAFDNRSLLTSYALYSDGQEVLMPRLQPRAFSKFMMGQKDQPCCCLHGRFREMVRNWLMSDRYFVHCMQGANKPKLDLNPVKPYPRILLTSQASSISLLRLAPSVVPLFHNWLGFLQENEGK